MKAPPEEIIRRTNLFEETLRRAGIKLTHQRIEIFREVAESEDHPDAETIYKGVRSRVPTVSLDTVYRTLWLLIDLGLIKTLGTSRARTRFDANLKVHHHYTCSTCGKTRDFYSKEYDELTVPPSVKSLGNVEATHVEIRGTCCECSEK